MKTVTLEFNNKHEVNNLVALLSYFKDDLEDVSYRYNVNNSTDIELIENTSYQLIEQIKEM